MMKKASFCFTFLLTLHTLVAFSQAKSVTISPRALGDRDGVTIGALMGFSATGNYGTEFMGGGTVYYERSINPFSAFKVGFYYSNNGGDYTIGAPVFYVVKLLNKRGRGFTGNIGVMPQHGWQPFLVPMWKGNMRIGFGKARFYMDFYHFFYFGHRYACAQGYVCPNGLVRTGEGIGGGGIGLNLGTYLR